MANRTRSTNTVPSPLCAYETHCGNKAALGPEIVYAGCVNRSITCLTCKRTGEESRNTK